MINKLFKGMRVNNYMDKIFEDVYNIDDEQKTVMEQKIYIK